VRALALRSEQDESGRARSELILRARRTLRALERHASGGGPNGAGDLAGLAERVRDALRAYVRSCETTYEGAAGASQLLPVVVAGERRAGLGPAAANPYEE
jgi:hypothetical protein